MADDLIARLNSALGAPSIRDAALPYWVRFPLISLQFAGI